MSDAKSHAQRAQIVTALYRSPLQYTLQTPLGELFVRSSEVFNTHPLGSRVGISFADHGLAIVSTVA